MSKPIVESTTFCWDPFPAFLADLKIPYSRVLVTGGRKFEDSELIFRVLDRCLGSIQVLIEGEANGADALAREWAEASNVAVDPYPAQWKTHGRFRAGPKRNRQMLREGKPNVVLAFPGGTGTADMCKIAKEAGLPVYYFQRLGYSLTRNVNSTDLGDFL